MAIKGKSKSRRAKAVTRGPKPAYVPVKTPLLRRRGLWIGGGAILGAGLIAALVVGLVEQRSDAREEEELRRMAAAIEEYRGEVEPILLTIGNSLPPTGFSALPNLASALSGLEAEEVTQEALDAAASEAEGSEISARGTAGLFQEIDAPAIVQGRELPLDFVLYVLNSREGFQRAMNLYRQAALLVTMAVGAEEGPARDDLVARARGVHDLAAEQFARAYADYVQAQVAAGAFDTSGGLPTVTTGPTG